MIQARLILLGAVVIAFMGLGLVAYHYKLAAKDAVAAMEAARRDLATAVAVNEQNQATIIKLEADKIRSDKLAKELADEVDAANQSTLDLAMKLAELRAQDADVQKYLGTPVPAALRGLYAPKPAAGDKNGHP